VESIKPTVEEPAADDSCPSEEDAAATLIFLSRSFAQDRRAEPEKKVALPPLNQHLFGQNVSPPKPGTMQHAAPAIMARLPRFDERRIAISRPMNMVGQESYKRFDPTFFLLNFSGTLASIDGLMTLVTTYGDGSFHPSRRGWYPVSCPSAPMAFPTQNFAPEKSFCILNACPPMLSATLAAHVLVSAHGRRLTKTSSVVVQLGSSEGRYTRSSRCCEPFHLTPPRIT
jgi:hypothetical protein